MAVVRPFKALRPAEGKEELIAALPYDVMNRAEAKQMAAGNPLSFLYVSRSEIALPDETDPYDPQVYLKAKEALTKLEADGNLVQDEKPMFYIYRQIMAGRVQTGLVATVSVDEYLENKIKKHEFTREVKELDRINNFDYCDANTAPIFLTYRQRDEIDYLLDEYIKINQPYAGFTSEDGIGHYLWAISDDRLIAEINSSFAEVDYLYIADGHHRSASAAKVGLRRREKYPAAGPEAEFNYFLAVIFPDEDLYIMDYNRVVKDLNNLSTAEFLEKLEEGFIVNKQSEPKPYRPQDKGYFGMYLNGCWYELIAKEQLFIGKNLIDILDVSILQQNLLDPILAIKDPRTDERIDFIGGIRGLQELADRVDAGEAVAFSLYPTTMAELLAIADADMIMPPKSTWFEPKLRSGLFVHKLSD